MSHTYSTSSPAAGTDPRRWWAVAALALSVLVVGLDLFVLSLALPTISASMHASTSDLQWFVDAYSLVIAAALLPAGLLGDRIGRRRIMLAALVLFGVASLACAYSRTPGELIAARSVLGIAAAVILPMSLAVLPVMFAPDERSKAVGAVGGAAFVGYPIGPIVGGWLLDHFWWGSVFLINIPIVALALLAVVFLLPESRGERPARIDVTGVAISATGLIALTYGIIKAGENGWGNAVAIATMSAGVVILGGFVQWERAVSRRADRQPLVDLRLLRSAGFSWGTTLATMVSFALFGISFAMPQYFLDVRGLDSLASGIRLLALIAGLMVGLAAGQLVQSPRKPTTGRPNGGPLLGPWLVAGAGFAAMAIALAIGTGTSANSGMGFILSWFAITGLGLGLALPTTLNAALGALTPERSGSGSALMRAIQQVGATIGVAVLGTVLSTSYRSHLSVAGLSPAAAQAARNSLAGGVAVADALRSPALLVAVHNAYSSGVDLMLWVSAAIAVTAAVLAVAFLPRRVGEPARPAAEPTAGDAARAEARAQ